MKGYKVEMPEMVIKDYAFMNEIVTLLKSTDHRVTDIEADTVMSDRCTYDFNVRTINNNSSVAPYNDAMDFEPNGSYFIEITYRLYDYFLSDNQRPIKDCIFSINNIHFTTSQILNKFFTGCKIIKYEFVYPYYGLFFDKFWLFEIRNGVVYNAFYYYEKDESDIYNSLVYDLINKNLLRFENWIKKYPHFLE